MATVIVDNQTYEVPDDATEDEINAITAPEGDHLDLSAINPSLHGEALHRSGVGTSAESEDINPTFSSTTTEEVIPVSQEYIPDESHRSKFESLLRGGYNAATLGFDDEIQAVGSTPVDLLASAIYGEKPSISQSYNRSLDAARNAETQSEEQNPGNYLAGQVLGAIGTGVVGAGTKTGKALADSLRSGEILGKELGTAGKMLKGGTAAATSAATYGYGEGEGTEDRINNAADNINVPAAVGAIIPGVVPAAKVVGKAVTPTIDEGLKEVARLAQKYNIPLSIDQITKSRSIKTAQKVSQEAPFSGQEAFRDKQITAWNKAVTKTLGKESDKITPEFIDERFKSLGSKFNELGKDQVYDPQALTSRVDEIVQDAIDAGASKEATDGFKGFVQREIGENLLPDGTIRGETLSKIRGKANKIARSSNNFDSKTLYHNFESDLIDHLLPDTAAKDAFKTLKHQYKNLLTIEPLLKNEVGGMVNPTQLSNRMASVYNRQFYRGKAGELGDLARVGKQLLPVLGGSDTTQKVASLAAVGSAVTNPASIPLMVTGMAANRAVQAGLNRNQALVRKLLKSTSEAEVRGNPDLQKYLNEAGIDIKTLGKSELRNILKELQASPKKVSE